MWKCCVYYTVLKRHLCLCQQYVFKLDWTFVPVHICYVMPAVIRSVSKHCFPFSKQGNYVPVKCLNMKYKYVTLCLVTWGHNLNWLIALHNKGSWTIKCDHTILLIVLKVERKLLVRQSDKHNSQKDPAGIFTNKNDTFSWQGKKHNRQLNLGIWGQLQNTVRTIKCLK